MIEAGWTFGLQDTISGVSMQTPVRQCLIPASKLFPAWIHDSSPADHIRIRPNAATRSVHPESTLERPAKLAIGIVF
jgi:hypothetical protein